MKAQKFFRTPKGLLIVVLSLLAAIALFGETVSVALPELLAAAATAMIVDVLILRWRKRRWIFPDGALLTGLLVGMILSPHEPWYVAAATAAVGVISKYIVRVRTANVFNPAALALVATFYLFDTGQSWWGALPELPMLAIAALIAGGLFIADRVNKVPGVLAFLGTYYLIVTVAAYVGDPRHVAELYRAPDLHAALFFGFFMVTDPPTSPPRDRDQIVYGVITAVVSYAALELIGAAYYLLAGLLVANIWEAARRHRDHVKKMAPRRPA